VTRALAARGLAVRAEESLPYDALEGVDAITDVVRRDTPQHVRRARDPFRADRRRRGADRLTRESGCRAADAGDGAEQRALYRLEDGGQGQGAQRDEQRAVQPDGERG
jgi:hypothetical protein